MPRVRPQKSAHSIRLALGFAALCAGGSPVEAGAVECGATIAPGSTVELSEDLGPCSAPFALRIEGPATLDLKGRTIACNGTGIGVAVVGRRVKVRNGRIEECPTGVALVGRDHQVSQLFIRNPVFGVDFAGAVANSRVDRVQIVQFGDLEQTGVGVVLSNDDERNTLVRVRAERLRDGIRVRGTRNRLENNVVDRCARAAFDVAGTRHVLLENVAISNGPAFGRPAAPGDGFVVFAASELTLTKNRADDNAGIGFRVEISEDLRFDQNRASRNAGHGFLVTRAQEVQLRRSFAEANGGDGIRVTDDVVGKIVVRESTTRGHAAPRFDLRDEDPSCADVKWQKNEFTRGVPACVN